MNPDLTGEKTFEEQPYAIDDVIEDQIDLNVFKGAGRPEVGKSVVNA